MTIICQMDQTFIFMVHTRLPFMKCIQSSLSLVLSGTTTLSFLLTSALNGELKFYLLGGNTYWDQGGFQHLAYQLVPALKLKKAQGCLACTLVALVQWKGLNYWSIEHLFIWFVYQNPCLGLAWWTITGSMLRIRAHSCEPNWIIWNPI